MPWVRKCQSTELDPFPAKLYNQFKNSVIPDTRRDAVDSSLLNSRTNVLELREEESMAYQVLEGL
jgi:hypothetical protein